MMMMNDDGGGYDDDDGGGDDDDGDKHLNLWPAAFVLNPSIAMDKHYPHTRTWSNTIKP